MPDASATSRPSWRGLLWLTPLMLAHIAVLVVPTWTRVARYCVHYGDLGIYAQALHELAPSTPNPLLAARHLHVFNDHFDPILWLAKPFAWLLPQPYGVMLAEQVSYAVALLALVWLYRRGRLDVRGLCLAAALLLLSVWTISAVLFPAHPSVWSVAPALWAAALLIEGRRRAASIAFVLLFACKEELPFVGVAVGAVAWLRGERRLGAALCGLGTAWVMAALVLRPMILGETHDYLGHLLRGLAEAPGAALGARLQPLSGNLQVLFGLAAFVPLVAWAAAARLAPSWALVAGLVPLLAVRFLGMFWSFHYMAPVVGVTVAAWLFALAERAPPRWVLASTLLLLLPPLALVTAGQLPLYTRSESYPAACAAEPERLGRVEAALTRLRREPGRKLVEGNLLPHLPPGDDTFFPGGPQPPGGVYELVLVEKPPRGDPFPLQPRRMAELVEVWRRSSTWILVDDEHLFMARGRFVDR